MKPLYVAFLWHMHQPIYKDPSTGKYLLPWVRLHALKGYTDLAVLSEKYPHFRQTINFTPSLLVQLEDYINNPDIKDNFLELTKKPADKLNQEDKQFILKNFFMNNLERIIQPHPRYHELYQKRGPHFIPQDIPSYLKRFTAQDFLDLQVLFNLMWFGFSAKKIYPRVNALIQQGKNFSEEDKAEVIQLQWQVMRDVIPRLKRLSAENKLELTCTPFYHPILPLLSKEMDDKLGFSWHEDAKWQVEQALVTFQKLFGNKPEGMWPSEGSVSEGAAALFAASGIRWIATDEEILLHSLENPRREQEIYEPHELGAPSNSIQIFFRDKTLSDLIGFGYHRGSEMDSINDLIQRLQNIRETVSKFDGNHIVSIILDGENPWEFYPEGGESFLNLLFERLSHEANIKTVTFSEYLDENPKSKNLANLHAGSWINHNFDIWHKHPEDLTAWKYVDETRRELKEAEPRLSEEVRKRAWNEIYMAEASDWYWWFGDEFFTETGDIFDYLFRSHLMQVYQILDKRVPPFLRNSIKNLTKPHVRYGPSGLVNPVIDGKVTNYYEWSSAGICQREHMGGAMYEATHFIDAIYYGFNMTDLFIRLDVIPEEDCLVKIQLHSVHDYDIQFPLQDPKELAVSKIMDNKKTDSATLQNQIAGTNILEMRIPFANIEGKPGNVISFSVAVFKNDVRLEECPRHGLLYVTVPTKDYEAEMWSA